MRIVHTDPLTPLLVHFSARARVFYTGNFCGHSKYAADATGCGFLHLLRAGRMRLRDSGKGAMTLTKPSLIFYSRPLAHSIDADLEKGADLACASVEFDHQAFNPIVLALPSRFVCALDDLEGSQPVLDLLFDEAFAQRPARIEVLNRLFELVLIQILRATIARGAKHLGFLRGLAHPQLSKALNAIHAQPEREWSLGTLAQRAGMSRSSFAEAFRKEIGETPWNYLVRWRITAAQALLRRGTPLKLVSERVGYGSQAGFLRAFKGALGLTPREWLHRRREEEVSTPASRRE